MTTFIDGPAKGNILMLKRAPIYLRAVSNAEGKWDACDQLEDTVHPGEVPVAYVLAETPGQAFIDGPRIRGLYPISRYQLVLNQPDASVMMNNNLWAAWTVEQGMPKWLQKS